ncbi:MAG: YdeI/OmpD-associated family protein [Solirubrobacteraceae bacterium]
MWLKLARRRTAGAGALSHAQALDLAICFGWIDGRRRSCDERSWLQRFTPRGPRSRWSEVNRNRAVELIAAGRVRPFGLSQVRAAQADGRWAQAYEPQSRATVPDDLQRALDAEPAAAAFFATLTGTRRYAFLYRLHHVKSPGARARRIASYIELLREHRTLR